MPKKQPGARRSTIRPASKPTSIETNDEAGTALYFRAQACHRAARLLTKALEVGPDEQEADAYPVITLYRQAVELHLKGIVVGPGGNYLPSKPDRTWAYHTRSLRRLAVLVAKILAAVGWDRPGNLEVESGMAGLTAIITLVELLDRDLGMFEDSHSVQEVRDFLAKMDPVIDFLDAVSDALAAMWDTRDGHSGVGAADFKHGGDFGSKSIQ